ncbi:uncharacterized protein LOC107370745 [Tetranychus urticae]|uniref:Ig-like domain-containing protein n=1 Tax=Tetranychus urticae TaxID=32264 RepID=T1JTG2_TETUR|nr:uncharacterized protein LOC107370745 [Tetranychus urticae]
MNQGIILFTLLQGLISFIDCLKIVMLEVPSPTIAGESVELTCSYDLEDDKLYSVKWYKDGSEFYRYVPKDWPHAQVLPMEGIKVDTSRSASSSVYLRYVDLNSAGKYRCEISAEAPSFNTAADEREMVIYALPIEVPQISIGQRKYNPGEEVTANCTSPKSKPTAKLSWFINDSPVEGSEFKADYSATLHNDGLESSFISLNFVIQPQHFIKDIIILKCVSVIVQVNKKTETQVTLYRTDSLKSKSDNLQRNSVSENLSQVGDFACPRIRSRNHLELIMIIVIILITFNNFNPMDT